ncbi:hypothetical protein [Corynebacterium sp. A21]|uniref:hypothetical protein n=1 Tax=Corynebacterium sp. A21 TaxID=3457318 RepID=UPI003FD25E00
MGTHEEEIRNCLIRNFPVWASAAADESTVRLGEVIRFSEDLFFFPDCTIPIGDDIYLGNEKLSEITVPLFIDRGSVIDDLLRHEPGSFARPGTHEVVSFPPSWREASTADALDCLWHALDGWLVFFSNGAEFETAMRSSYHEDSPHAFWFSCYFSDFSTRIELRFRSTGFL